MHLAIRRTRRPSLVVALAAVLAAFPVVLADDSQSPPSPPGVVEVRFTDGSILKLTLKDAKLDITTPYGKLSVPVGEIQKIDFATRLTDDATRRIEDAIPNLGHPQFAKREEAVAELFKLRAQAYPALLEAAKSKDAEVSRRAGELLDRIRDAVPAELLEVRRSDVIQTADSKFAGRIEGASLRAASAQFGDVQLKLTDVRSLRIPGLAEDEAKVAHAEPDPGTLVNLQNRVGESFHFRVTGATGAIIWGTDVYTTDSALATAAVHAGVLRAGQTGVVKVTILASPPVFNGSTRHGVTSQPYGPFAAGYKVSR